LSRAAATGFRKGVAVAEDHGAVDVFRRGDLLLDHPDRLHRQGDAQAGGREPRRVADRDDLLAEPLPEGAGRGHRPGRRLLPHDQLEELHERHRVEEVHADDARRGGMAGGDP
jgi:hypothetical protein